MNIRYNLTVLGVATFITVAMLTGCAMHSADERVIVVGNTAMRLDQVTIQGADERRTVDAFWADSADGHRLHFVSGELHGSLSVANLAAQDDGQNDSGLLVIQNETGTFEARLTVRTSLQDHRLYLVVQTTAGNEPLRITFVVNYFSPERGCPTHEAASTGDTEAAGAGRRVAF